MITQLTRAGAMARQHLEREVLRPADLSWTAFSLLRAISATGRLETRHAAAQIGIAKATLTGVADTLVGRDLVRRVAHVSDRRLVHLELTRRGQRLLGRLLPSVLAQESHVWDGLDPNALRRLATTLDRLIEHLDRQTSPDR